MNETNPFAIFASQKYLSLETIRKNGDAVRTPIWFAGEPAAGSPATLYCYSVADAGKVKRIRNNPRVRIAPCDIRGNVSGAWVDARAELVTGDQAVHGSKLLSRKYMPFKQILAFFALFSRKPRVVFALRSS